MDACESDTLRDQEIKKASKSNTRKTVETMDHKTRKDKTKDYIDKGY